MLFVFNRPGWYPFWMWGMRLPMDLIWLRKNRVVGYEENLQPPASFWHLLFLFFLKCYRPPELVDGVLEVPAGFCRQNRLERGCHFMFKIKHNKGQAAVGYALALATVAVGVSVILNSTELRQGIAEFYTDAATRVIHSGKIATGDVIAAKEETWGSTPSEGSTGGETGSAPAKTPGPPASGETGANSSPSGKPPPEGGMTTGGGIPSGGSTPGTTPSPTEPGTTPGSPSTGPDIPELDPLNPKDNMSRILPNEGIEPAQCDAASADS